MGFQNLNLLYNIMDMKSYKCEFPDYIYIYICY